MPLFMDRHDIHDATAEQVAAAHSADMAVQDRHACKALTYWFDEARGVGFCLVEAPSAGAVSEMHREAHGLIPNQVIEVNPATVSEFLGRVTDPDTAESEVIRESAFRAVLFVDMVRSTDITRELGDAAAFGLARQYRDAVRNALLKHGGREVNRTGDGFLTSFDSAFAAVQCAIAIQSSLAAEEAEPSGTFRVQAKVGVGAGEPVLDGDDLFGSTINLTSRICDYAQPGQILASRVVRDLCMGKGVSFSALGQVDLKGFDEAIEIEVVDWR
jgi:class 3 adenylate cyclase